MTDQQTVFVVDNDPHARSSIATLIKSYGGQSECYESADSFWNAYDESSSGCVVTGLRRPGMNGLELHETLAERGIQIPIVLVTAYANTAVIVRAMQNGAVTVLDKPCRDEELWNAIRDGLAMDADNRRRQTNDEKFREGLARLTSSERNVLALLVDGLPHKAIASALHVSVRTVEARRQKIFKTLQTRSLARLVRAYVEAEFAGILQ